MRTFLFLIFLSSSQWAFSLTPKEVVDSSLKHYPAVKDAVLNFEMVSSQKTEAEGAFDGKIVGKGDSRTSGFYSGDYGEAKVVKPLKAFNSKIYGGVRQSDDLFPDYEGKFDTLSQGEVMFGLSLSLLRDSFIDERRFNLLNAKENEEQSKLLLTKRKVMVQTLALKAYWEWFALGHQVKVHKGLLELAQTRNSNLRKRIKAGDLARIYGTENEQYILRREAKYLKSRNIFQKAALVLSLFYRNEKAEPKLMSVRDLPDLEKIQISPQILSQGSYTRAESRNLKLKILDSKMKQAKGFVRLGKNLYLPKLDFSYEYNKDSGTGPDELIGGENRFMLNFEIPLEFNKARGKKRAGQAKLARVKTEASFVREKLRVDLNKIGLDLKNSFDVYRLTKRQIKLAQKLVKAEERKFRSGASDLILVNLREQLYAKAQIDNLKALSEYQNVSAELKNLLVEFL